MQTNYITNYMVSCERRRRRRHARCTTQQEQQQQQMARRLVEFRNFFFLVFGHEKSLTLCIY